MTWLRLVLDRMDETFEKKVIINMHVPPGVYYPGKDQTFWSEIYTEELREIVK
jgi:hypothetical protein